MKSTRSSVRMVSFPPENRTQFSLYSNITRYILSQVAGFWWYGLVILSKSAHIPAILTENFRGFPKSFLHYDTIASFNIPSNLLHADHRAIQRSITRTTQNIIKFIQNP
jgi:hypothetical protein